MKNIFILLTLFLLTSCNNSNGTDAATSASAGYINVTPEEFKLLMAKPNTVILDVRTPVETDRGVIEGAVKLDYKSKDFDKNVNALDKNKTYLLYCHAGGRSSNTCKVMKDKGFNRLYNLDGGYAGWE